MSAASGEAPAPKVAFLGVWDRSGPLLRQASAEEKLAIVTVRPEDLANGDVAAAAASLRGLSVLYALNINTEKGASIQQVLRQGAGRTPASA